MTGRRTAPGPAGTVRLRAGALDALSAPVAPAGIVLGADEDGAPVTLALLRPVPTRVVVLGALHLARQVALRTVAQGARLSVTTGRRAAWEPVARAAADPDRVRIGTDEAPPEEAPPARTTPAEAAPRGAAPRPGDTDALLTVHDRGATAASPAPPAGPWRATMLVLPALSPAVADAADDADVVLLGRMPPQEADLAARLWRLTEPMAESLRTLPDHGVVVLGRNLWRRLDLVTAERETALIGPVRRS
ncbi:hypothetical protein LQ327_03810 [Actinomycetospora endophytica]|uniref:Uncharacterized protein n=1 Tax=Actinomycetospora endophytica TaxID=2291215 RepID=A0ABS8P2R3_9PSEU|nr:hypothetical protein [Actinomycetospora endophytica]MCD2192518.1 hypothetical protein [Actinomycetospora endophytica]